MQTYNYTEKNPNKKQKILKQNSITIKINNINKKYNDINDCSETQSPMLFWGQNILQNIFFCAPKKKLFMPSHTETYLAN